MQIPAAFGAYSVAVEQGIRAAAGEGEWDATTVQRVIAARWNTDLGMLFLSSAAWWLPVNTLNFLFVPTHLRVLPTIFGAMVWNTFFSLTAHREHKVSPDVGGRAAAAGATCTSSASTITNK